MEERVNNVENQPEDPVPTDFTAKSWKTDLTLIVEGKPIYLCKQVLALVSPVFDALFGGDFKERNQEEMELPGKKHEDFCEFLRCIYPDMLHRITLSNVKGVLPLADEYQVVRLKTECETFLLDSLSKETSAQELYQLLQLAYLYNLDSLKPEAIALLVGRTQEDLDDAAGNVALPPDVEIDLQRRMIRILKANSEQIVEKTKTLVALNGCLATVAKENQIMSEYSKGKWNGDSAKFEVYLMGDLREEIEIHLSKIKFSMKVSKTYSWYKMRLTSASDVSYDVRIMGMIIVKNWMAGKANSNVFFTGRVRSSSRLIERDIGGISSLEDESQGYMYDGKIKGDIYILILEE